MSFMNSKVFNRVIVPISFVSSLTGGILLLKEKRGGKRCPTKELMKDKICVITGANSGIGKFTAEELARRGATVVMGCRHMGKCEEAAREIRRKTENAGVVCRFLDLASLDTVEEFSENLRKEIPRIDVLINNAGVMKPRPPRTTPRTTDNFERQFGVNYLGHFLLTNLLLDKLSKSPSARVINLTSDAYAKGQLDLNDLDKSEMEDDDLKLTELYYQSKLAVVLFTDYLSRYFSTMTEYSHITANCLNPGVTKTRIGRHAEAPLYAIGMQLYKPIQTILMRTPAQGAQTSIYLAVASDLKDKSGGYFDDCNELNKTCNVCDSKQADDLWDMSEQWTDVKNRLDRVRHGEMKHTSNGNNQAGDALRDTLHRK